MKHYNGFSPAERMAAYNWLKAQYQAGTRVPPTWCDACGQTAGTIEPHSEDYSAPYGDHIGAFGLCYRCHMMIHCRHRNPAAWDKYREVLREGSNFPGMGRNFQGFAAWMNSPAKWQPTKAGQAKARTVLDGIHEGVYKPGFQKSAPQAAA